MTTVLSTAGWLTGFGRATAAVLVLAAALVPAFAARKAPERSQGGLTKEERIARMQVIHAEVSTRLPVGHDNVPVFVEITQADRDSVDNPVTTERAPQRIGVVKQITQAVGKPVGSPGFQLGVSEEGDDSFVWAVTITSPEAQAIRLHIENFSLPENAELFLLGADGQADGPYVGLGRNGDGDFWTRSISGDTGTIVVRYTGARPAINKARTTFEVTELGHIRGRRPRPDLQSHDDWPCSDNELCVEDAMCPGTDPAVNDAKDAVAKLEWITGQFINTCTGGLIADTDTATDIPLMLSANHCFSGNISNLETFFNYTTDSCNGPCPDSLVTGGTPPAADTVGMTVDATNSSSDYTLMTLSEPAPAGAVFLGWNSTPVAFTNDFDLFRISNANFGPQVYSAHSVDTGSPTCGGIPRGAWIYSKDDFGATMGGSSGSPVVNAAGEIVGQLTGCCGFNCANECDSANNWTIDGAFADYFNEVESILDPVAGCSTDAECDDGLFCTGDETCVSGSCQSAGDPCVAGETCNDATDACDLPTCDSDGACEPGEDCNNCPTDCAAKVNGNPRSRYCCDGDITSDCGDARCSEGGFSCGDQTPQGCTSDAECEDNLFCTGFETCVSGSCQSSGDLCGVGETCDEGRAIPASPAAATRTPAAATRIAAPTTAETGPAGATRPTFQVSGSRASRRVRLALFLVREQRTSHSQGEGSRR